MQFITKSYIYNRNSDNFATSECLNGSEHAKHVHTPYMGQECPVIAIEGLLLILCPSDGST